MTQPNNNPYAAQPQQQLKFESQSTETLIAKPVSITIFGILNLLFGLVGVVSSTTMIFFLSTQSSSQAPNGVARVIPDSGFYIAFIYSSIVATVVFSTALTLSGWKLLASRPLGRRLANIYGIYAILACLAHFAVNYMFFLRPTGGASSQAAAISAVIVSLIGGLVQISYPALLLIFINRPNVVAYLKSKTHSRSAADDGPTLD